MQWCILKSTWRYIFEEAAENESCEMLCPHENSRSVGKDKGPLFCTTGSSAVVCYRWFDDVVTPTRCTLRTNSNGWQGPLVVLLSRFEQMLDVSCAISPTIFLLVSSTPPLLENKRMAGPPRGNFESQQL